MKLTKANVTKLLTSNGITKSVMYRGRITQNATEGFEYERSTPESLVLGYRSRSSSFATYEIWTARKKEKLQKIVEVLNANGFVVTTDGNYVTVTKG